MQKSTVDRWAINNSFDHSFSNRILIWSGKSEAVVIKPESRLDVWSTGIGEVSIVLSFIMFAILTRSSEHVTGANIYQKLYQ
jgi:hypothetical protein